MPITPINLAFDVADLLGVDYQSGRTKVWIETNVDHNAIVDPDGNTIRLGVAYATVGSDGTGTFTGLIPTNAATNPTAFQYRVWIDYPEKGAADRSRTKWDSGWFSLTATSNLADVVAEQYVPPTYISAIITELEGYVDEAEGFADAAEAAASTTAAEVLAATAADVAAADASRIAAEAAEAAAQALVLSDLGTTDGQTRALVDNLNSQTAEALEKFSKVFRVKGSNTIAITAAVLAADADGGGTVYFPAGSYSIGSVTLPQTSSPLIFKGAGIDKTIITKTSSAGTAMSPTHGFVRDIGTVVAGPLWFEDFTLTGQGGKGQAYNVYDKGIYIADVNPAAAENPSVHINRVKATKHNGEAFYTSAAFNSYTENVVTDCAFNALNPVGGNVNNLESLAYMSGNVVSDIGNGAGVGNGVEAIAASLVIVDNTFSRLTGPGIVARSHYQAVINGNIIREWAGTTIGTSSAAILANRGNAVWAGPSQFNIAANMISGYPYAVIVQTSGTDIIGQVTVTGNTINNIQREAIWLQASSGTIKSAHVLGNSIVDAGQAANDTYSAILAGGPAGSGTITRPVIQGNIVASTTATKVKHGVRVRADDTISITDALIKDNDLRDAWVTSAIQNNGTGTVQVGNLPGGTVPGVMLVQGVYLWPNGTDWRTKASAPTSLTDGALVGPAPGAPVVAIQTGGDKTLTQSDATNYQSIPGLSVSLAVGTYLLSGSYIETEGTTTADIRFAFAVGGGLVCTGSWSPRGLIDSAATTSGSIRVPALPWATSSPVLGLGGAGSPVVLSPTGVIIVTTAGTLQLQARQGTSEASNVVVRNSVLQFAKIA